MARNDAEEDSHKPTGDERPHRWMDSCVDNRNKNGNNLLPDVQQAHLANFHLPIQSKEGSGSKAINKVPCCQGQQNWKQQWLPTSASRRKGNRCEGQGHSSAAEQLQRPC